jgi:hypothetical protein
MFIAALFTIAKLWKQPRCPNTDEWIKKMWYLYTMEFYAAMKKNEILLFSRMDGTGELHVRKSEQAQKVRGYVFSLLCGSHTCKLKVYVNTYVISCR